MAAATREGAKEAIADALRELFADSAVLAVLRGGSPAVQSAEPKPSAWTRLKAAVRAAATRVTAVAKKVVARVADRGKPIALAVTTRVRQVRTAVTAAHHLFELGWRV